jgi:RimJ/RimL family protein N-acetyltransferase
MNAAPSSRITSKIIDKDPDRCGKWIQEHGGGYYREGTTCIGLEKDGDLVAGVMYDYFNGASIYMHVAAVGKNWLNRDFLWFVFYYPFIQLGAKVIIGLVESDNEQAKKFDEHIGFKLNQSIPGASPNGDLLIYTMNKEDCKWFSIR